MYADLCGHSVYFNEDLKFILINVFLLLSVFDKLHRSSVKKKKQKKIHQWV